MSQKKIYILEVFFPHPSHKKVDGLFDGVVFTPIREVGLKYIKTIDLGRSPNLKAHSNTH